MFCSVALLCHIFPRLVPFASIVFRLRSSAVSRKDAWTETSWRVFRLSTSIPGTAIWIGLLQCGISNDEGSTALKWRKVRRLSSCAAMRNARKGFVTKFELRSFARLGTYCLRISRAFSCQYSIRLRLKWLLRVPIILTIRLNAHWNLQLYVWLHVAMTFEDQNVFLMDTSRSYGFCSV